MLRVLLAALVISMVLTGCGKKEDPNATEINPWGLSDDGAILGSGSGSDYMPGDMPLGGGLSGVNFTDPSQYHDPAIAAEAAATLRTLYFKYNSYDIQSAEEAIIQGAAAFMKKYPKLALRCEGHCDERGTEEYNMALGSHRAGAVREYLINLGVPSERIDQISYGESLPAVQGRTEEAYAKNRRVEFKIGDMR